MHNTDLCHANLTEADLSDADLSAAILINANLTGAKLSNTNFQWAALTQVIPSNIDLSDTIISRTILPSGSPSDR